jgi:hypothetical protein
MKCLVAAGFRVEPPIGIEPMTYALREARSPAPAALPAQTARRMAVIALIAPEFHYVPFHDSFHGQAIDRRYLPATLVPALLPQCEPSVKPGVPPSARGREDCGPARAR